MCHLENSQILFTYLTVSVFTEILWRTRGRGPGTFLLAKGNKNIPGPLPSVRLKISEDFCTFFFFKGYKKKNRILLLKVPFHDQRIMEQEERCSQRIPEFFLTNFTKKSRYSVRVGIHLFGSSSMNQGTGYTFTPATLVFRRYILFNGSQVLVQWIKEQVTHTPATISISERYPF